MKTSCIPICFFGRMLDERTLSVEEWIQMAADMGFDRIEMYKPYLQNLEDESCLRGVSNAVRDAGLEVSMFTSYGDFSNPDEEEQRRQIESVKQDAWLAGIFETDLVRMTCGSWPEGAPRDETLRTIAAALRRVVDVAAQRGVTIALEDHPDVGTRVEDFVEILDRVDDERLKVNLDTSNPMVSPFGRRSAASRGRQSRPRSR